jgi:hypothetical protein
MPKPSPAGSSSAAEQRGTDLPDEAGQECCVNRASGSALAE